MKRIIKTLDKLRVPAKPLEFITETGTDTTEGEEIIAALKEILKKHEDLLAISAPQIGFDKRIFGIKFNDTIKIFINPIITKKTSISIAPETFSSMPNKEILVSRPDEITAVYYTDEFKYEDNKLLGAAARLFDQMSQTLDGILPDDVGLVSDVTTDGSLADLSEEEINELKEFYKQFIKTKTEALNKVVAENEEAAKIYKQLQFTENVITGHTAVVKTPKNFGKPTKIKGNANNYRNSIKGVR